MYKPLLICLLALGPLFQVPAGVYSYTGSPYAIPDGNISGVSSTITVSGESAPIENITVTLDISGGYNGDLYGYLEYNGVLMPLVNRIGVDSGNAIGAAGAGMTVTLSDTGAQGDIHLAGNAFLTGDYQADGRNIDPLSSPSDFDSASRQTLDASFGGMDPDGTWELFFADVSAGGGVSFVEGWSLDITTAPEPVNVALTAFAVMLLAVFAHQNWKQRELKIP